MPSRHRAHRPSNLGRGPNKEGIGTRLDHDLERWSSFDHSLSGGPIFDLIALRTPWGAGGVASPAAPPGSTYPAHLHEPPIQHRQTTMAPKRAWLGTGRRDLARNHANRAETNRRQLIPPHRCRSKQSGAPADLFRSSSGIGMPVPHMRQLFAPAGRRLEARGEEGWVWRSSSRRSGPRGARRADCAGPGGGGVPVPNRGRMVIQGPSPRIFLETPTSVTSPQAAAESQRERPPKPHSRKTSDCGFP